LDKDGRWEMSPKDVNDRQLALLRRVAEGVEPVTSREYHLATTMYALRNRGLVTTKRMGGGAWIASITEEGRYYLAHGHHRADAAMAATERSKPTEPGRKPLRISGEDLIQRLVDAGGSFHVVDPEPVLRAAWRRAIHAAATGGNLPAGMRLWHTGRDKGDLMVRLVARRAPEAKTQQKAPSISVPERLIRPHAVVARIRELSKPKPRPSGLDRMYTSSRDLRRGLDVSRPSLGRALRILQALITEAERRGYGANLDDKTGDPRVRIRLKGHEFAVSVREKDGVLRVILPSEYSGRRLWSDGIRAAVEDKLGDVLANIEARADEAEHHRLERERREEEDRLAWEQVMERARERFAEDQRAALLRDQVAAWRLAADIRSFCSAARGAVGHSEAAVAWLAWATAYADAIDPMSEALAMPQSREPSPEELRPYLRGWNPYGPI
jgi:DNA-binding IscR family transcriptional regulator